MHSSDGIDKVMSSVSYMKEILFAANYNLDKIL